MAVMFQNTSSKIPRLRYGWHGMIIRKIPYHVLLELYAVRTRRHCPSEWSTPYAKRELPDASVDIRMKYAHLERKSHFTRWWTVK